MQHKISTKKKKRVAGFTLIELMITVGVIGILAAIAYPSYKDYVTRAKRADGKAALLKAQLAQEKYRANNSNYSSDLSVLGFTAAADTKFYSTDKHYEIAISGTPTATTYAINAAPSDFTDSKCETLGINQDGDKSVTGTDTVANCWGK